MKGHDLDRVSLVFGGVFFLIGAVFLVGGVLLSEVRYFSLGWGLFPRIGFLHLADGSRIPLIGIEAPNPPTRPNNRSADRLIADLNRLVGAQRP